ncbi:MAG: hypothetical protein G8345_06770 [Magnetococcales bacterium]|nr:hypothetical protein [Magnetococcales bacterium]NGZ26574.1 hypothetical protein [Magnetococcales bacterium]
MSVLPLDQLTAGMVVATNVCDASGRILLSKGSAITDRHLRIFKTWGVADVDVVVTSSPNPASETDPNASSMPIFPKSMEPFCKKAEVLFRHADMSHPAVQQLFAICVQRVAQEKPEEKKRGI